MKSLPKQTFLGRLLRGLLLVTFLCYFTLAADPVFSRPSSCRAQEGLLIENTKFPRKAPSLPLCHQYKECTCCNSSHTALIQHNLEAVLDSGEVSPQCATMTTMMACRVCDPVVGVGMKQAVCKATCEQWFRACREDFFHFTSISQRLRLCDDSQVLCSPLHSLASDGTQFCELAGHKVSKTGACFDGLPTSSHNLCSFGDPAAEDHQGPSSRSTFDYVLIGCLWLITSACAYFLGPKIMKKFRLLAGGATEHSHRTRGIGSNDPATDPYYKKNDPSQKNKDWRRQDPYVY